MSSRRAASCGRCHIPAPANGAVFSTFVEHDTNYEDNFDDDYVLWSSDEDESENKDDSQIDKIVRSGFKRLNLKPQTTNSKILKRFDEDGCSNFFEETPGCSPIWPRPSDGRPAYWKPGNGYSPFHHPVWRE